MPPIPQISVPISISGASPSVVKAGAKLHLGSNISIENTYDKGFNTNNLQISTNSLVNCYALNTNNATINGLGNFVSNGTMSIGGTLTVSGVTSIGSNFNVTGKIAATSSVSGSSFIVNGVTDPITGITPVVHTIDGAGNQTSVGDSNITGALKALSFTNSGLSFVANSTGDITCNSISSLNKVDIGTLNNCTIISNVGDISATKSLSIGSGVLLGYADSLVTNNYAYAFTVDTNGAINAANGLFTLDSNGNLDTAGFLKVGTNNALTVDANGDLYTSGHLYTAQDLSVGSNSAFTVSSSGVVAAKGSVSMGQNLSVGTNGAFTVSSSGIVATTGSISTTKNLSVASGLFTVDTFGNVAANGTLKVGPNSGLFNIDSLGNMTSSSGVLSLNNYATTSYSGYTSNIIDSNLVTPAHNDPLTGALIISSTPTPYPPSIPASSTKYLTTQTYVDDLVYKYAITPLNAILGADSTVLTSFAAMTDFLKSVEGVATVQSIVTANNGLVAGQTQIQTSVMQLANQAINTVPILCSPAVWADGCMPLPIPGPVNGNNSLDGWWFSNSILMSDIATNLGSASPNNTLIYANNKINWYLPANKTDINGMSPFTLGQLQLLYINFTAFNTVSGAAPWIDVFTASKNNTTDYWYGICNAKIELLFNNVTGSAAGTNYCLYAGATASSVPANVFNSDLVSLSSIVAMNGCQRNQHITQQCSTLNGMFNATYTNTSTGYTGPILTTNDKVAFFCIETDSTPSTSINFILHSLGLMGYSGVNITETCGTTIFSFGNNGPATNYMYNTFFQKNSDMSVLSNTGLNYNQHNAYNAIYHV